MTQARQSELFKPLHLPKQLDQPYLTLPQLEQTPDMIKAYMQLIVYPTLHHLQL